MRPCHILVLDSDPRANPIFRHPPINAAQGLLGSVTDSLSIRKLDPSKLTTGTATLPIPMYSGLLFLIHVSPFIYVHSQSNM